MIKQTKFCAAVLCPMLAATAVSSRADISVSSDPVGYYRVPLTVGFQTLGITLVNSPAITTRAATSDADSVTSTEATLDVGAILDPTDTYYIEVVDGPLSPSDPHVGHHFEVDEDTTINTAPDGVIALDSSAATNSLDPIPALSGYLIELRKHITLGEAFDKDQLHAALDSGQADQVQIYNGTSFDTFYLFGPNPITGEKLWGDASFQPADNLPISPGVGMLYKRSTFAVGEADVVVTGKVRANPFVQPLDPGFNFVAEPYPVTATPIERGAIPSEFLANFDSGLADQVQIFNGTSFETYYLAGSAAAPWDPGPPSTHFWLWTEDLLTSQNDSDLFDFRRAAFFKKSTASSTYKVPLGWNPGL